MKWIYGKQDFKTLEKGEENCYLMTNGLGGFSSMNMMGGIQKYDAFLMACTYVVIHRYNLIHRIREEVELEEEKIVISSQEFQGKEAEKGYEYLSSFVYDDTPLWRFHVKVWRLSDEHASPEYQIHNRSKEGIFFLNTFFFSL